MKLDDSTYLAWSISLTLLGLVAAIFAFVGTAGEGASLLGRIAAFSLLALALVMFVVYILHRHRGAGSGGPKGVLSSHHNFPNSRGCNFRDC